MKIGWLTASEKAELATIATRHMLDHTSRVLQPDEVAAYFQAVYRQADTVEKAGHCKRVLTGHCPTCTAGNAVMDIIELWDGGRQAIVRCRECGKTSQMAGHFKISDVSEG